MKTSNIIEIATRDWDDISMSVMKALQSNDEYLDSRNKFDNLLKKLDRDTKMKISDLAGDLCMYTENEAFNEGFAHAVKLMSACFSRPNVED